MTTPSANPESAPPRAARVVGLLLGALLTVGGVFGAQYIVRNLLRLDAASFEQLLVGDAERIEAELARREPLDGFLPGDLGALHAALGTELRALQKSAAGEIPADTQVFVRAHPPERRRASIARLGVLAFPVQFYELDAIPAAGPDPSKIHERLYILDLEPLPTSALDPWFSLVAERSTWRLWRGKGGVR